MMQAADDHAGGMVQCPQCGQEFMVEASPPVIPVVKARTVPSITAVPLEIAPNAGPPRPGPQGARPVMPPRGVARPRVELPSHASPSSGGTVRWVALVGAVIALLGGVIWVLTQSGGGKKDAEAAEKAREERRQIDEEYAKQAAAAEKALKDIDKRKKEEELRLQSEALTRREKENRKQAEEAAEQTATLHELADRFFSGDTAAFEAFNKVWQSSLFDIERIQTDNDPSNDLATREQLAEYRYRRILVYLQKDEILTRWMKDHGRDPDKFVRELMGMKTRAADPDGPAKGFDFSKYASSGSGFFVSPDGWILTNEHVVGSSTLVDLRLTDGKIHQAKVIKTDDAADLALLKADISASSWLAVSKGENDLQLGRTVLTVGYPSPWVQGVEPKYTDGKISAASGIGDRKDSYQTTVPVQHGNSGGALVDATTGWVVGVVNARLEDARGSADNVSYSIKGKIVRTFLDSFPEAKSAVEKSPPPPLAKSTAKDPVIDRATTASVLILRQR